jgi:hypothetical protein
MTAAVCTTGFALAIDADPATEYAGLADRQPDGACLRSIGCICHEPNWLERDATASVASEAVAGVHVHESTLLPDGKGDARGRIRQRDADSGITIGVEIGEAHIQMAAREHAA